MHLFSHFMFYNDNLNHFRSKSSDEDPEQDELEEENEKNEENEKVDEPEVASPEEAAEAKTPEENCENDSDVKVNGSSKSETPSDAGEDDELPDSVDISEKESSENGLADTDLSNGEKMDTDVASELNCDENPEVKESVPKDLSNSSVSSEDGDSEKIDKSMDVDSKNQNDAGVLNLSKRDSSSRDSTPKPVSEPKNSDSDKENASEAPMDLSRAVKMPENTSDVITLSDEDEEPRMNGAVNGVDVSLDRGQRLRLIKRLQEELRNEEANLVLLKKIRQSQFLTQATHERTPESTPRESKHSSHHTSSQGRPSHSQPPPLVRGTQHSKESRMPPQLMRAPGQHQSQHSRSQSQGPPPLVMAPRHNEEQRRPGVHEQRRSVQQSGMPNLIPGYNRSQPQAAPQPPPQPEQTPAQRQAAAKLALRKQLEKTLLQIPPPKPPPPEMNFIPGVAGNEFIMLVGLEEVVKNIVDTDARNKGEKTAEVKYVFNPFICVQCGSDFTPVWKRDKPGSKNVICEQCVTSNQKKALKQEHTNRLKSAFVKALQQEQEIEQRMQATSAAETKPTPVSSSTSRHSSPSTHSRESSHASAHSAPINLSSSTSFKPTSEQIRQHQNLIHAHQAQLRAATQAGALGFNPRHLFPFQQAPVSGKAASELQRQYLLDMIPRSMPAGTVQWRL